MIYYIKTLDIEIDNRKDFEDFIEDYIHRHGLYDLNYLLYMWDADTTQKKYKYVRINVEHHPLRIAREIFGYENAYLK